MNVNELWPVWNTGIDKYALGPVQKYFVDMDDGTFNGCGVSVVDFLIQCC